MKITKDISELSVHLQHLKSQQDSAPISESNMVQHSHLSVNTANKGSELSSDLDAKADCLEELMQEKDKL